METYFPVLEECLLFRGVESGNICAMLRCLGTRTERYEKGETILAEGDRAEWMGVVLSGAVDVMRVDYDGCRRIINHLGPGELFGEAFACAGVESLPVDVVAASDAEILRADVQRITASCSNACEHHARLIRNLLYAVSVKNLQFHEKLEVTSRHTTREKLLTYLQLQSRRQQSRDITIPFDRQALADYLGVERSGLSAEISRLRSEGVLDSRKNRFILSDPEL